MQYCGLTDKFIIKNYPPVKKQTQERTKESRMTNNKNIHAYMQAAVSVMFTYINTKKVIKLFGERSIVEMIK